jgi:hypothetical protein
MGVSQVRRALPVGLHVVLKKDSSAKELTDKGSPEEKRSPAGERVLAG